jgi:exodeoxyribonuclease V alpha subunit
MILENDYKLNLYNGDVGIILKNENFRDNMAFFLSSKDDELKPFLPARLPAHESVYAMTIHKSQGSDFDEALIIIPEITEKNKNTLQILTRELLYTAVTRAKHKLTIWAKKAALMDMASRTIERNSGLGERLWGDG